MNSEQILWPVVIQIALTVAMFILLGKRKLAAVKSRSVDLRKAALDNSAWPDDVRKVSNNIQNQFQIPVLFYVLCLAISMIDGVSWFVLMIAWCFSLSRIVHAYVHVGSNNVPTRSRVFIFGCVCILILTAVLAIKF